MASSKTHRRVYGNRKKRKDDQTQKDKLKPDNKVTCKVHSKKNKIPFHEIAKKFQVSIHAAERYAERVFGMDKRDVTGEQIYMIAESIRSSLPEVLINEARYNIIDNYYAIVNNGMVVTIISVGRKK